MISPANIKVLSVLLLCSAVIAPPYSVRSEQGRSDPQITSTDQQLIDTETGGLSPTLARYLVMRSGLEIERRCQHLATGLFPELGWYVRQITETARANADPGMFAFVRQVAIGTADEEPCREDSEALIKELLETGRQLAKESVWGPYSEQMAWRDDEALLKEVIRAQMSDDRCHFLANEHRKEFDDLIYAMEQRLAVFSGSLIADQIMKAARFAAISNKGDRGPCDEIARAEIATAVQKARQER